MITPADLIALNDVAIRLNVTYADLFSLIMFESGFNPQAKNPRSSARGLIQFIDSTARSLGYTDSLDLVTKNPTIQQQLPLVEAYLKQYAPFNDKQDLYLSVFYPKYRRVDPGTVFPDTVQAANPGITTVRDYIDLVDGKKKIV